MTAELSCVDPKQAAAIWPHVSAGILRAMERGGMGHFHTVENDVLSGNAYLWLAIEGSQVMASAVTQVFGTNGTRHCTIVACAGQDWEKWGNLIEGLEKYAHEENCNYVEICGRPGWLRRLPGYRLAKIVIRKDV